MKKIILYLILICFGINAAAQTKTIYRRYHNTRYHFSFEIPVGWKIESEGDGMDYLCMPVSHYEKKYYAGYGYVFQVQVMESNLDSAASEIFSRNSDGEYIYSPPFTSEKKVDRVKGRGFAGLHEVHSCRVGLNKDDPSETTIVDGCEQFYLSNGKITLRFDTNGLQLDDTDYEKLLNSLRFDEPVSHKHAVKRH